MKCPATSVEQAWHALSQRLRTFLRSRVPSDADADDLLQDVFVRVHEKIGSLQQWVRMESWVYQIARNAVADFYRRRVPRPAEAVEDVVDSINDPETSENLNRSVAAWLLLMIDGLPNTLRDAVRMYEIEGIPQAEIAKRLNISLSGAKSRVQRGRHQLEEMLRNSCELEIDRRGNVIACKPANDNECGQVACACDQEGHEGNRLG
jgi:RNA polymerase sigma-70 factor (ECF subfamily)